MSIPQLARLQPVSLREAWPHEAGSFTPWLARCENLQLLGDTIDMTLECEAQEHAVGDFSADTVCRDLNTDRYVLMSFVTCPLNFWQAFMDYLRTTHDFPNPPKALCATG